MKSWNVGGAVLCFAMAAGASVAATPQQNGGLHMVGPGLYVRDLAGARQWYEAKLGLTVMKTYPTAPGSPDAGQPYEYIMSFGDGAERAVLVLTKSTARPAGPNTFARVILEAPDARGLAIRLKAEGVEMREVIPDVAYFLIDPEGNKVELYTPPKL
jgi:catechol 2,3-dioxygenase-like lactoylglutathione lyase family enzyme